MSDNHELAACIGDVSVVLMGAANKALSSPGSELRFGKKGSISVDLKKGTWFDHSDQSGGGTIDLVKLYKGFDQAGAVKWLVDNGYIKGRDREDPVQINVPGGFPEWMNPKPVAVFEYFDDKGKLAYQVLKFPKEYKDKDGTIKESPRLYQQRRPHPKGKGWVWGLRAGEYGTFKDANDWWSVKEDKKYSSRIKLEDARWWLYRRDEVIQAKKDGKKIVLVEGEKDAETLRSWGFVATTNQGGAKNWKPELDEDLTGADVVICSDYDKAGSARINLRGSGLSRIAKSVQVVRLEDYWPEIEEGNDVSDWRDKAKGNAERFAKILVEARMWKPERPKSMFGAIPWSDRKRHQKRLEYLVEDWLTTVGVSVVGGRSSSGKSFLALHISMCVARGLDFFGRSVRKRGVIYQAGEGGEGVLDRMDAYAAHFNVPAEEDVPFELLPGQLDVFTRDKQDVDNFITEVNALSLLMAVPAGLIVVDTLRKAAPGLDEISGKDNAVVINNIYRIARETKCHVMLVHHTNADGKKLRGHTSMRDDVDQVILIEHDKTTGIRNAVLDKIKDGEDGLNFKFTLLSLPVRTEVRHDGTDKVITSCAVVTVSEKEHLKKEQERQGFTPKPYESRILVTLFNAINKYGFLVSSSQEGPEASIGKSVVDFSYYLDVAVASMVEVDDRSTARDTAKKQFTRGTDFLKKANVINVDRFRVPGTDKERSFIWWTGKPIRGFANTFPKRDLFQEPPPPDFSHIGGLKDEDFEL